MSVPTSNRATSYMEYVETARKLARAVFSFTNRLPKRLAQRLSNPMCNHATELLYEVQAANRTYVKSDEDYERRRGHLFEALGHLDHVAALLDIAFDVQEAPNENVYSDFATRIDLERKLVKGVIRKDRDARRRGR